MARRRLRRSERRALRRVFGHSLPLRAIVVSDRIGLWRRPFCIPNPNPLRGGHLIAVGRRRFRRLPRPLLIHEATHVWQSVHGRLAWGYVLDSAWRQAVAWLTRDSAYHYHAGASWSSYGAEQQAEIVRDWDRAGRPRQGPLWPYLRDVVRQAG